MLGFVLSPPVSRQFLSVASDAPVCGVRLREPVFEIPTPVKISSPWQRWCALLGLLNPSTFTETHETETELQWCGRTLENEPELPPVAYVF